MLINGMCIILNRYGEGYVMRLKVYHVAALVHVSTVAEVNSVCLAAGRSKPQHPLASTACRPLPASCIAAASYPAQSPHEVLCLSDGETVN